MSKEASGVGLGALPPNDDQTRQAQGVDRLTGTPIKMSQGQVVAGQYVYSPQSSAMTLKQLFTTANDGNSTNVQSVSSTSLSTVTSSITSSSRPIKRPLATQNTDKKDTYAAKLQRVINHRIVRSKLVKEKYNEHLMEAYYLENENSILDLYQFAKRPKTQAYLAYLSEHSIDPNDFQDETPTVIVPQTTPSTPSATPLNSLPGISSSQSNTSTTVPETNHVSATPTTKSTQKIKSATQSTSNQEMIVEKAKQEAYVVQRISDLQKDGIWSEKRLPKVQEAPRTKAHWDFLLEEMVWLAADFAQERKWKKAAAKKCARMVQKYFQDKALTVQRAEKAQEQHIRRIAAFCAKEIKNFWNSVEKLVEYKQNTILEEKRKKALDQQLSFIVDQTEKYSQLLAEGMNKTVDQSQRSSSRPVSDDEFDPEMQSEEDDEETIDQEEAAGGDNDGNAEEVEALQKESQMELDDLLNDDILRDYLLNRDNIKMSGSEDSDDDGEADNDDDETVEKKSTKSSEESESVKDEDDKESSADEDEANDKDDDVKEVKDDGLEVLLDDSLKEVIDGKCVKDDKDDLLNDAAAIAESIQPKGNTLSSTNVSTNIPFLLKYTLREYQHIGLDWLVTMFERKLNGILADEMGLGKTIQTIALLAHLACEKGNWGPHLIIVPTSVMLNWEMECKKWCPAFKILTYYGSQKERKFKRIGWTKPNAFHICITSYKLVVQDHQSFRRKKWKYLILDEAQNIKNFKSQRWQLLLNFQTQQRLLLTGTPLQNNLMELWSLMHFLMPNVFQSHREFKEWFSNPVTGMIEGNSEYNENIIKRLHKVLRPFLLRRLKSEVEKQMPKKYEHVIMCRLSKRQRYLYDDYMSRAKTKETLASGNLLSVINVLMQLRKVCNHPNLFEVRPTTSPFQCVGIRLHVPSIVYNALDYDPFKHIDLYAMNLLLIMQEIHLSSYQCYRMRQSRSVKMTQYLETGESAPFCPPSKLAMRVITDKNVIPATKVEKVDNNVQKIQQQPAQVQTQYKAFPAQNVKIKVSGVRFFSQQALLKTIPVVNISQPSGQISADNITTADRIATNFAQLVQTSTGKHLLLTANPNATGNMPSTDGQVCQKLTFLPNQAVSTLGTSPQVAKAFVKFQLGSVASTSSANVTTTNLSTSSSSSSATTTSSSTTGTTPNTVVLNKGSDDKSAAIVRLQVGNDYVNRLYSNQNSLDVRWPKKEESIDLTNDEDPKDERRKRFELMTRINDKRCSTLPLYGRDFQDAVKIFIPNKTNSWTGGGINCLNALYGKEMENTTEILASMLLNPEQRVEQLKDICDRFIFYVPAVNSSEPELQVWHPPPSKYWGQMEDRRLIQRLFSKPATPLHHIASAMVTQFPDPRLIQYDCGKLQTLDRLLRRLKSEGHRVLVFTQMSKMLDVLEAFLNYHGYIYLRLDGTTKVDQRQVLMERFNGDSRIFAFILSTRSGGVGVNLTGADTVIFYDSDWNPTMDAQAQDRCHRIGQTKDVHIYRLVSERTIEENILKKANQKRLLGDLAIEGGNFTTAYFKSSTIQDLFNIDASEDSAANRISGASDVKKEAEKSVEPTVPVGDEKSAVSALETALAECEDDQDVQAAKIAKAEAVADLAEFDENIPLDEQDRDKEPEVSKAEQEINNIIKKLSPIEKYAMKFIETTESAWSAEQLAAAEQEIENQKREWEQNRLAALKEEEERRNRELEEDSELLTFSRDDAANQVSVKSKKIARSKLTKSSKKRGRIIKTKTASSDGSVKRERRLPMKRKVSPVKKSPEIVQVKETPKDEVHEESEESQNVDESSRLSDDVESSGDSVESEYNRKVSIPDNRSLIFNKLDHNSPRTTRSRGTVAINLWTLDVSPILPGEKPTRRPPSPLSDSDEEKEEKPITKTKSRFQKIKEKILKSTVHEKQCKIILNDILLDEEYVFPKVVCYSKKDFDKPLHMVRKSDLDTSHSTNDDSLNDAEENVILLDSSDDKESVDKNGSDNTVTKITSTTTTTSTTSSAVMNHLLNHKDKTTIQSKLLSETMKNEKIIREEIKKSLNVEANFNAKFHIPKKSTGEQSNCDSKNEKDKKIASEEKSQLSDISDDEFSINDSSNPEPVVVPNYPPPPPPPKIGPMKPLEIIPPKNRLFVTTSSYQETFKTYIQTLHRIPNPATLLNNANSTNPNSDIPIISPQTNRSIDSQNALMNRSHISIDSRPTAVTNRSHASIDLTNRSPVTIDLTNCSHASSDLTNRSHFGSSNSLTSRSRATAISPNLSHPPPVSPNLLHPPPVSPNLSHPPPLSSIRLQAPPISPINQNRLHPDTNIPNTVTNRLHLQTITPNFPPTNLAHTATKSPNSTTNRFVSLANSSGVPTNRLKSLTSSANPARNRSLSQSNSSNSSKNHVQSTTNDTNSVANRLLALANTPVVPTNSLPPALHSPTKSSLNLSAGSSNRSDASSNRSEGSPNVQGVQQSKSTVQQPPRRFSNHKFPDTTRKYGKFRNSNHTLDSWLTNSKKPKRYETNTYDRNRGSGGGDDANRDGSKRSSYS